jgi:hypothetical protein
MPTDLPSKPPSLLIEIQSPLRSTWGLAQINAAGQLTRIGQACCRLGLRPVGRLLVWLSIWWLDRLEWHGLGIRHEGGLILDTHLRFRIAAAIWSMGIGVAWAATFLSQRRCMSAWRLYD